MEGVVAPDIERGGHLKKPETGGPRLPSPRSPEVLDAELPWRQHEHRWIHHPKHVVAVHTDDVVAPSSHSALEKLVVTGVWGDVQLDGWRHTLAPVNEADESFDSTRDAPGIQATQGKNLADLCPQLHHHGQRHARLTRARVDVAQYRTRPLVSPEDSCDENVSINDNPHYPGTETPLDVRPYQFLPRSRRKSQRMRRPKQRADPSSYLPSRQHQATMADDEEIPDTDAEHVLKTDLLAPELPCRRHLLKNCDTRQRRGRRLFRCQRDKYRVGSTW